MTRSFVCLILLCLLFPGCSKDTTQNEIPEPDKPVSDIYFTFLSNLPSGEANIGQWVVVHDSNGQLMDYKSYETGQKLEFGSKDPVTEDLWITRINAQHSDTGESYSIVTTAGVDKGSEIVLNPIPSSGDYFKAAYTGTEFEVHVTGIPAFPAMTATNGLFQVVGSASISSPGNPPVSEATYELGLYEAQPEYFLTILDGNNILKYLNFTYEGSNIDVDYSNFTNYDAQYHVNLPEEQDFFLIEVAGFAANAPFDMYRGAILQSFYDYHLPDPSDHPVAYGYLDIFPKYRTVLVVQWEDRSYSRVEYGARVEHMEVPDPVFTVLDASRADFRFETDANYSTAQHRWNAIEGSSAEGDLYTANWYVETPPGIEIMVLPLPEEILTALPQLEVDGLEYYSTTLKFPVNQTLPESFDALTIQAQ